MEHITSDIKNIKTSLYQMSNYILNKKVEKGKINDFKDFKGIGKEAWNFISAIYNKGWDVLIADSNSISFRNKVATKFKLKITFSNTLKNNNVKDGEKLASINKLFSLIPAKTPKKVNKITEFFKKGDQSKGKTKSYAQASNLSINNTMEVLKIKEETFPNL